MTTIFGWGRYPRVLTTLVAPLTGASARMLTAAADGGIARGNGRSYGDAAI